MVIVLQQLSTYGDKMNTIEEKDCSFQVGMMVIFLYLVCIGMVFVFSSCSNTQIPSNPDTQQLTVDYQLRKVINPETGTIVFKVIKTQE